MKYSFLLFGVFASLIIYAGAKYPTGIVGTTKLNGEGCTCHNSELDSLVKVWIEGPDTLQINQSANYKIYLSGGPQVKGGYNAAALFGSLSVVDSFSTKIDIELTHAFPQLFNANDTISWEFEYTAPSSLGADTLYSAAMSVNGDAIPTDEDKWNFGNNFIVTIVPPSDVKNEITYLKEFLLKQNYPNPFNPSTRITYQIPSSSHVTLTVYDALGNKVEVLVNEYKLAGSYVIEFKSTVLSPQLASGIYYYCLESGGYRQTKKMVFIQ